MPASEHIFWLLSRSFGLAAMLFLSLSVAWGLSFSSRMLRRGPGSLGRDKQIHEALSLSALGLVLAHGLVLLGDNYIDPTILQIFVPFAMPRQPVWTGVGIVAGWVAFVSGLAHYAKNRLGPKWKIIHRFSLLAWVLALAHTIGSGSDTGNSLFPLYMILLVAPVCLALVYRLLPAENK